MDLTLKVIEIKDGIVKVGIGHGQEIYLRDNEEDWLEAL